MLPISVLALTASAATATFAQDRPAQQPAAPAVSRLGSRDLYGPGIVAARSHFIEFELTTRAHVIALRVDPDGSIQPVFPSPQDPTEKPAGRHTLEALPAAPPRRTAEATGSLDPIMRSADGVALRGHRARPSAAGNDPEPTKPRAYWLLIVSDVPMTAADLQARLESMDLNYPSVKAEVEDLARALTNRRTRKWTAYYAPVSP